MIPNSTFPLSNVFTIAKCTNRACFRYVFIIILKLLLPFELNKHNILHFISALKLHLIDIIHNQLHHQWLSSSKKFKQTKQIKIIVSFFLCFQSIFYSIPIHSNQRMIISSRSFQVSFLNICLCCCCYASMSLCITQQSNK